MRGRSYFAILIVGLGAASAHADEEMPCTETAPLRAVLACLKKKIGGQAEIISPKDAPASVRIVRVGSGQGHFVYVVAGAGDRWTVIDKLYYEQGHGKRESSLTLARVTEEPVTDGNIVRVDYHTNADTTYADAEETEEREETALCAPGRRVGCVHLTTACAIKREPESGETETDSYKAKLAIAPTGEAKIEVTSHESGKRCKLPPTGVVKLW